MGSGAILAIGMDEDRLENGEGCAAETAKRLGVRNDSSAFGRGLERSQDARFFARQSESGAVSPRSKTGRNFARAG